MVTLTSGGLQRFSTAAYDDFVGVQNAAVINLSFSGTSVGIIMKEVYRKSLPRVDKKKTAGCALATKQRLSLEQFAPFRFGFVYGFGFAVF